ncbi:MAG: SDR family NAD(P)-dependent oxidoreductase [Gammaproteobacteria bacterium]
MIGRALFAICHWLLALLIRHFFGISVTGAANLPAGGPCLIAANHNSHLDTALVFFLLGRHKHALHALAAQDHFFGNRVIRYLVTHVFHALAVDRRRFSPELADTARDVIQRGGMLLIYPEGGRGDGSRINRFKPGVGYLALTLDVPVVPLHISGTARAFPKGAFWPRPVNLQVRIGTPLHPAELAQYEGSSNAKIKRFTQLLEARVRELGSAAHGPWALVTGASSGAGRAMCGELARRGFNLYIAARRANELEAIAGECRAAHGVEVEACVADLTLPEDRERLVQRIATDARDLRLLVNNAGIGALGMTGEGDAARHQTVIALNVAAVVALTDALVPRLRASGGMILNVGSVYSVVPAPGQAVYSGSKAFVRSWSRALQRELAGSGVSVTLGLPGSFISEFHVDMGVSERRKLGKQTSAQVAAALIAATIRRRGTVVPGFVNKLFLLLCAPLPLRVTAWLMQTINHVRGLRRE